jgi:RNA-directed DNA polymerase
MDETSGSTPISTRLERIATLARQLRDQPLTTLAHHIDLEWLREAHRRTRKDGATGVDGQPADAYAAHLEDNLRSLLERAKSGTYRAPPVRRAYIPKDSGEMRPLGIPTFEDKVLQRAVAMVLEAVYEPEFLDCSYGFRPGRSAQQALDVLHREASKMAGGWIIEVDIRKYFDSIDHERLREVRGRIRDGVIQRLIGKWLNAGVLEDGAVTRLEAGSPQGGVVSPVLANIFLHEVLDVWFHREVCGRLRGRAHLVRYADDAVMLFEYEEDARRVMTVLPKRFGKYSLTLHPGKTRLLPFKRPDRMTRTRGDDDGPDEPGTFNFLGFTIHWARSPMTGKWVVKMRTAADRFRRALRSLSQGCKANRHEPLDRQQQALNHTLRGHYGYYGRKGNRAGCWSLQRRAVLEWWRWLRRRSQRGLSWDTMARLLQRYPLLTPGQVCPA